jgi:hypothetical protein
VSHNLIEAAKLSSHDPRVRLTRVLDTIGRRLDRTDHAARA